MALNLFPNRRFGALCVACAITLVLSLVSAAAASVAPTIDISGGPAEGSLTNSTTSPTFDLSVKTGSSTEVDFYCSLDDSVNFQVCDRNYYPTCVSTGFMEQTCSQAKTYPSPADGTHVFRAFATECDSPCDIETDGIDGPITSRTFSLDRSPPNVSSPVRYTARLKHQGYPWEFYASEPATFSCWIDTIPAVGCTSPFTLPPLSNGPHGLFIRATDSVGNLGQAYRAEFRIDIFKPKKCRRGKSEKAKAKRLRCMKANAKAKKAWQKKPSVF